MNGTRALVYARIRKTTRASDTDVSRGRTIPMYVSVKLHLRDDLNVRCFVNDARKLTEE